jgi:hypothetical protein
MIETAHMLIGRDRELNALDRLLGELASVFPALRALRPAGASPSTAAERFRAHHAGGS